MTRTLCSRRNGMVIALVALLATSPVAPFRGTWADADEPPATTASTAEDVPETVREARARARLLHETVHGALQVMHRDFFRDDEKLAIPSRSLEDVFRELARIGNVEVRWLAVNTDAMNVDHKPQNEFETNAIKVLAAGKQEFESSDETVYRYAGVIQLSSQCLKCHAPNRMNTDDRAAGLVITMPLRKR